MISARACGQRQTGENTLVTSVGVIGRFCSLSPSLTAKATAEPASRARTRAVGSKRKRRTARREYPCRRSTPVRYGRSTRLRVRRGCFGRAGSGPSCAGRCRRAARSSRAEHDHDGHTRAGDVDQLQPREAEDGREREAGAACSGIESVRRLPMQHARDRAEQQPARRRPCRRCRPPSARCRRRRAARPRGRCPCRRPCAPRSGKMHEQRQPEEDAAADRRQADDEPAEEPISTAATRSRFVSANSSSRDGLRVDEALRDEADAAEEQRAAEHASHRRLDPVAVRVLEPVSRARRRASDIGARAEEHPAGELRAHVAHAPVLDRPDRLEDRAVGDVRADRHRRVDRRRG